MMIVLLAKRHPYASVFSIFLEYIVLELKDLNTGIKIIPIGGGENLELEALKLVNLARLFSYNDVIVERMEVL